MKKFFKDNYPSHLKRLYFGWILFVVFFGALTFYSFISAILLSGGPWGYISSFVMLLILIFNVSRKSLLRKIIEDEEEKYYNELKTKRINELK